jgi:hypothetical protein
LGEGSDLTVAADNEGVNKVMDERGFIVGWLVKLAFGFLLTAVVLFDSGSIMVNFFTLDSTADDIAVTVSNANQQTPNRTDHKALEEQALALARDASARLVSFEVDDEGTVRLQVRRRARTLLVERIGPIRDWARATADGKAGRSAF